MSEKRKWLVLSYRVPSEPSTLRVRVWRTLKSIGAYYLQQSVCVLPLTADIQGKAKKLQNLISNNHGEVLLLEVEQFSNVTEEQMVSSFKQQRQIEYREFVESCDAFLEEIVKETSMGKFTYHEVEENEVELIRLKRWHRKILKRDFFQTEYTTKSQKKLDDCITSLKHFTDRVYREEGNKEGELI
ncbi:MULTISPECIES: Chromate resistance protein ChrB [unclassified Paenibacillus]|uniref:Chromate resistance protein ChrB n=1 Tax=unclassified Paenibacillus TaxID=185978 RepID=UPI00363CC888